MQILRIGIQTRSLRQPLRRALETAARLGADGVEIDARGELPASQLSQTAIRQLRKMLDDLRLRVSAISFITRRGYDALEDLDRRVLATQAAMKFARSVGADAVVNRVGRVPQDGDSARFTQLVDVLTGLGAYGERVGARLAAQTGSESGADLARLLAALPDGAVGVDFHPSGLIHGGHDPQEALAALGRSVIHVHACDAVRDPSRNVANEVDLGRGTTDFPAVLARLEEYDYRGWLTVERQNAAEPVVQIGNAIAFLRSL